MSHLQDAMKLYSVNNVDFKSGSPISIFTTSNDGTYFYPVMVCVRTVTATGIILAAAVNVGTNPNAYSNIFAGFTVSTTAGNINTTAITSLPPVAPNTTIYVKPSTLGLATTYNGDVILIGFYK